MSQVTHRPLARPERQRFRRRIRLLRCVGARSELILGRTGLGEARVTLQERSDLILTVARVLYINGQATEEMVRAAETLGRSLGLRAKIIPRWGELQLQAEDKGGSLFASMAAVPTGVDMDRVAATRRAIKDLGSGRLALDTAVL